MNSATRRTISHLETDFDRFRSLSGGSERQADRISGWSVGQHLNHLMQADRRIFGFFETPMDEPMPPLSRTGRIILWTGWIPRGKARAPKAVAQPENPGAEQLVTDIGDVRELVMRSLEPAERLADPALIARHHLLGGMSAAQWLRFTVVHHRHHLKIVRDILRADAA